MREWNKASKYRKSADTRVLTDAQRPAGIEGLAKVEELVNVKEAIIIYYKHQY